MNVHQAITEHSRKQQIHLEQFLKMDQLREQAIEEAVRLCTEGKPYSVDAINRISDSINAHAHKGISPTRVRVTEDMIREYVHKLSRNG